jgi:nitrilase
VKAALVQQAPELLYADLDLAETRRQKWMFDVAGHYSRPDVFRFGVRTSED